MENNEQKENLFLEEVAVDERYSRKVHKFKALLAVVVCFIILTVINWSTIVFVADYVKELTLDVYNKEGITVFPENYNEIFEKVSPFSGGTPIGITVDPAKDPKDSIEEKTAYTEYCKLLSEKGLEKAEKVKRNGDYIYLVSENKVGIFQIVNNETVFVSDVDINGTAKETSDIFVYDDRLVILGHQTDKGEYITAEIYDISDKSNVTLVKSFGQSGKYIVSCMKKDALYLISKYGIKSAVEEKPETFVPLLLEDENSKTVSSGDICIYSGLTSASYVVITGIDISGEPKIVSNKSLLGYGNSVYLTENNIYITSNRQKKVDNCIYDSTDVTRLEFDSGKVKFKASGNVPGYTYGNAALAEYDDTVCIVTRMKGTVLPEETTEKKELVPDEKLFDSGENNCLYLLDKKLGIVGKLEGFLGEEKIYSAFRIDDKLYFDIHKDVFPCINIAEEDEPALLGGGVQMPTELYPFEDKVMSVETQADGFVIRMLEPDKKGSLEVLSETEINFENQNLENVNSIVDIDEENSLISVSKFGKIYIFRYNTKKGFEALYESDLTSVIEEGKLVSELKAEEVSYIFCSSLKMMILNVLIPLKSIIS